MTDQTPEPTINMLTVQPFPPPPVCWPTLNHEQTSAEMTALQEWLGWLVDRYGLDHRTVPICWHQHGALVEELSALYGAWNAAYAQSANASAPLDWHANFAATRQRLSDWVARAGCRPDQHRPSSQG